MNNIGNNEKLSITERVVLWTLLILWITFFLIGILVNSEPFRIQFAAFDKDFFTLLKLGIIVATTYTLTNVAFLCIISGMLGALAVHARLGSDKDDTVKDRIDSTSPLCSAVLRSFCIYLALISGVLLIGDEPTVTTAVKYVKIAGLMSLIGFIVNYNPEIFLNLLEKTSSKFSANNNAKG